MPMLYTRHVIHHFRIGCDTEKPASMGRGESGVWHSSLTLRPTTLVRNDDLDTCVLDFLAQSVRNT